ncbi:MAG: glycosyltransferase family 4 protein [Ignavibacteriaceae bacterium]|nr:glycosyltransferase family 4 protein [Ignavibacteriaceae bacterium]
MQNKNLKVLEIITLFSIGGATETVVSMAEGLMKLGMTVHIATGPNIVSEGSMYETAKKLNINVFTFKNLKRDINLIRDAWIIFQLYKFVKKGKYDIVHTHSSKAGVVGRIAAWLARTPVVLHTVHGLPFHRYQPKLKKKAFIFIEKFSSLFCDKLVAVTDTIISTMLSYKIGNKNKYAMIRSSFDIENYKPNGESDCKKTRHRFGIEENDIIFGKIARLSELKGHKYFLDAFRMVADKMPNAKLLIVGNGELEYELKRFVKENELEERIIFTGLITPEEIPSVIEIMDVVVHTSLLEGLARVLPQAIMMEKPVISFDLDGAHEIIKDGINGYLIKPLDTQQLGEKLVYLYCNPELIKLFGKKGKEILGDQFSSKRMVHQITELYFHLFNSKK